MGWHGRLTKATLLWEPYILGRLSACAGFDKWDLIGISTVGERALFADLQTQYKLAPSEGFRYLQISHAIDSALPKNTLIPDASPMEDALLLDPMHRKAISLTYRKLINNQINPTTKLRATWEGELGDFTDEDWQDALSSPRVVAIPMRLPLIQLKILHRVYYDAPLLHRLGRRPDPLCLRRCNQTGTFLHIIWDCPYIQQYWTEVTKPLSRSCDKSILAIPNPLPPQRLGSN